MEKRTSAGAAGNGNISENVIVVERIFPCYGEAMTDKRGIRHYRSAFTLIELLIVIAIMAIIIGVIGACLSGGIRVWDRAEQFDKLEHDAFYAMDIMEKDLRNSLSVYRIGFKGNASEMSFPVYVNSSGNSGIGKAEYILDERKHALMRLEETWRGRKISREKLLENVQNITFTYYNDTTSRWNSAELDMTNFPDRVEIELFLDDGVRNIKQKRKILLPVRER